MSLSNFINALLSGRSCCPARSMNAPQRRKNWLNAGLTYRIRTVHYNARSATTTTTTVSWVFFLQLFGKRTFRNKWHRLLLPVTQPTVSKYWRKLKHWPQPVTTTMENHPLAASFLHSSVDSWQNGHRCHYDNGLTPVPCMYSNKPPRNRSVSANNTVKMCDADKEHQWVTILRHCFHYMTWANTYMPC